MPAGREIEPGMWKSVGSDQAGERREWQVGPVYGMGEQQRIAWRRLDGPKIIELDDETVVIEERRADDLTWIVKPDGRVRIFADESLWHFKAPGELSVLDVQIDWKRNEKAVGHGVDEGRAFLNGQGFLAHRLIECLLRHGLVPVGEALHRWDRPRQQLFEFDRTSKRQRR